MKPRVKVITLGVSDLEKSLAFYRDGMGLATDELNKPHAPPPRIPHALTAVL